MAALPNLALPGSSIQGAARLVLKIGSSLLVDNATGKLNRAWLESIADELARLQQRGQQVRSGGLTSSCRVATAGWKRPRLPRPPARSCSLMPIRTCSRPVASASRRCC
jgi:hypothetical protein